MVIHCPYELPMSAQTCTQPRSEVATVSVCCGVAPEPIPGRRRCIFGSWHLQTAHTSDHCDLRRCTVNHTALSKHSDSMHRWSYVLPCTLCRAHTGQELPPCLCAWSQTCTWCGTIDHGAPKQHEGSLPSDVTARHRLLSGASHHYTTPQKRRRYQTCTNRNDSRPC